jgi:hypothetical protein
MLAAVNQLTHTSARTGRRPLRIALAMAVATTGVLALSPFDLPSASAADVWSAPENLSVSTSTTSNPQVSSDSAGNAVAVWMRVTVEGQTPDELCDAPDLCVVETSVFDPGAETWSAPFQLSPNGQNAAEADVVMNGNGDAMAIWRRTSAQETVVEARFFDGATWLAADVLSNPITGARGPQISVGSAGTFTAVWYRAQNQNQNLIESSRYTAGSWAAAVPLSTEENAVISRVVTDDLGRVIAVWRAQLVANDPTAPYVARAARFSGGSWGAPQTISSGTQSVEAPQVAIDGDGNAIATWHQSDGANTLIRVNRYSVGSGLWQAVPETLSATGGNALNPRIESDSAGNMTILWRRFDSAGYSVIQTRKYTQSSGLWGVVVNLSATGRQANSQRLAVDPAGNVTAVWRRNNAAGEAIVQSARYSPGTNTWGAARDLSAVGASAFSPATDVDASGTVIVVWTRSNGTVPVVQASRSSTTPGFVSVAPKRVFDTRPGESPEALRNVQKTKVGGTYELAVQFSELPGGLTPATGLGAVSMNVTVVDPDNSGFLTVFPCANRAEVSNVNFVAGQTVANAVIAPVSGTGTICFFSNTPAHVIADINGYFPAGAGYTPVTPKRVLDTRPGASPDALLNVPEQQIGGVNELRVSMLSLPQSTTPASGVGAVSLNVTVTNPVASGFLTVYPCANRALVSSVNFVAGQTVANAVIAPLSPGGEICFFSNVSTDVIADISGWFPAESGYAPAASPARVLDTRAGQSPDALRDVAKQQIGGTTELRVQMTELGDVTPPLGVGAVSLNVTVTNPIGPGFVTVYPCGDRPAVSSVNFVAGQTVANAVIVPISAAGELCFFSNLGTDLIVDINGFFATTVV